MFHTFSICCLNGSDDTMNSDVKIVFCTGVRRLEWMRLKGEYKKLQRESMQELKKQLQDSADQKQSHNTQENQPNQSVQIEKENKEECAVKELPFTPGVVLYFKCLGTTDLLKSDIRVSVDDISAVL